MAQQNEEQMDQDARVKEEIVRLRLRVHELEVKRHQDLSRIEVLEGRERFLLEKMNDLALLVADLQVRAA